MPELTIRADADARLGAGHAARCLALAEAWTGAGHGPVRWVGRIEQPFLRARMDRLDVRPESRWPATTGPLVVDLPDPLDRAALRSAPQRPRVLVDDATGDLPGATDIVWVPHVVAPALARYTAPLVLTGPEHLAIRADLPRWAAYGAAGVGVMIGGGAVPEGVRAAVAAALAGRSPVVAAGAVARADWDAAPLEAPWDALARCARVVIGAGTTVYEAAVVGAPVVAVVMADNQLPLAAWLSDRGVPVVDARGGPVDRPLAERLRIALDAAAPVPPLRSGLDAVIAAVLGWSPP